MRATHASAVGRIRYLQQQVFGGSSVDVFQRINMAQFHIFVDLVNAFIRRAKLVALRTDIRDGTAIRRAACRGQAGIDTAFPLMACIMASLRLPQGVRKRRPPMVDLMSWPKSYLFRIHGRQGDELFLTCERLAHCRTLMSYTYRWLICRTSGGRPHRKSRRACRYCQPAPGA